MTTADVPPILTHLDRPNSYIGRSVPRPNLERLTQGRGQYVSDVVLRFKNSSGVQVGPDFGNLTYVRQRSTEPYGSPPNLMNGEYPVDILPDWNYIGSVCVRQDAPLPVMVTAMTIEVSFGG